MNRHPLAHLLRRRHARDLALLQDAALAPLHAALTAEPAPTEVAGEQEALVAYRAVSWGRTAVPARRRALWRPAVLTSVITTALATKVGAAAAAGTVALSGAAAAAYTGNLPDTLQDVAHKTIKAPAAKDKAPKAPPAQAVGPDATGPAAWGLCQAFAKDEPEESPGVGNGNGKDKGAAGAKGKAKERSVAYRNLVRAAGGEDKVEAYCATIPRPSDEPDAGASKAPKAPKASKASKAPKASKASPTASP